MKLQFEWAQTWDKPQPLPLVKEYFGEKVLESGGGGGGGGGDRRRRRPVI